MEQTTSSVDAGGMRVREKNQNENQYNIWMSNAKNVRYGLSTKAES